MTRTAKRPLAANDADCLAHTRSKPKRDESTAGANPTADEPGDGALNPQQQLGLLSLPVELLLRHILSRLSYYDMDQLRAATRLSLALIQAVKSCHGGEFFFNLRRHLRLPVMQGTPTLVGLHTLLESTQYSYRAVACIFIPELMCKEFKDGAFRNKIEHRYPGLFQKYSFSELAVPPTVKPLLKSKSCTRVISPCAHIHELHWLSHSPDVERIVAVIEAFLKMLNSPDLLDNFRTIVVQASHGQQGSRGHTFSCQVYWYNDMLYSRNFDAFIHRIWLEVIGGGNIDQLRYYLMVMLAVSVIPHILGAMIWPHPDAAFTCTKRIHLIPGFIDAIEASSDIRVDYFEFIVAYLFERDWVYPSHVIRATQCDGGIGIGRLPNHFKRYKSDFPKKILKYLVRRQPSTCLGSDRKPSCRKAILTSPKHLSVRSLGHEWLQIFPRDEDILG